MTKPTNILGLVGTWQSCSFKSLLNGNRELGEIPKSSAIFAFFLPLAKSALMYAFTGWRKVTTTRNTARSRSLRLRLTTVHSKSGLQLAVSHFSSKFFTLFHHIRTLANLWLKRSGTSPVTPAGNPQLFLHGFGLALAWTVCDRKQQEKLSLHKKTKALKWQKCSAYHSWPKKKRNRAPT